MKKLALALLVGSIAACGGGKTTLIDGSVDAFVTCSPIAQTGCSAGEKCTWIVDIDGTATTDEIGHIGCITSGNLPEGMACSDATAAANGGADTCVAGQLCISNKCKPICDPQLVDGSAAGACKVDFSCSVYAGVFESGGTATAGVCEPGCDPLSQQLKVTKAEACGSIDPTKPSSTCVPSRGFLSFHCAPSGSIVYDKTDRVAPLADLSGNPFGNGCAPGFIPFYFEGSGSMNTVCTGLCAPLKTDNQIVKQVGHETDNQGDKAALAKLTGDAAPVAGHGVCKPNIKGAPGLAAPAGQDCRFVWFDLAGRNPAMVGNSPFNNTLGVCFAYEKFVDIMIPGPPAMAVPEKSCAELPPSAPDMDPFGAAPTEGCYPLPSTVAASGAKASARSRWASSHRLANPEAVLVRHVFD